MIQYCLQTLSLYICITSSVGTFLGNSYWNDRYGSQGIAYTTTDRRNGLWSDDGSLRSNYLYESSSFDGVVCSGCVCDDANNNISSCSGPTVILKNKDFYNITLGAFEDTVTSITIMNCPNFELFEDRTFENLTNLQELLVQGTALNHVPDLSNTAVTKVNLAGNAITLTTNNHRGWTWPSTIEYIAMMDNQMHWLPPYFVNGPNLRMASFSNNILLQIHPTIFGDTSSLMYLGMDGNRISRISRNTLAAIATNTFLHLNISNNRISFIQDGTFSQFPALKILEVHQNYLPTINFNVFSDIPTLLHLDLHNNDISALPSKSFLNLPALMELRLHSQKTPMSSIAYDAWRNIDPELVYLFVSDNNLPTFPHQVLEEGYYPKLEIIYADNNAIVNVTEYGSEAFGKSQVFLHYQKLQTFTPYSAYSGLHTLYLHANSITQITNTDFCNMTNLQNLYLGSNLLTEDTIDGDAFKCLPVLDLLSINSNLIQYVPDAVKNSTVLPALTQLYMRNNKLTFLEAGVFTNLTTLSRLELTGNGIIAVENGAFNDGIQYLYIDSNEFRFLHKCPFTNLTSLRELRLSNNEIQYIPGDAFANCTSLMEIQLAFNNIPQILKSHFQNCPLSGDILLNDNDIGWIEDGTFSHVTTMSRFTVANNFLSKLPKGDFIDLTVVDNGDANQGTMDFSNNRLIYLDSNTFQNVIVAEHIYFQNNFITYIATDAFNGLQSKSLNFQGNPMRELQTRAFTNISLSEDLYLNNLPFTHLPDNVLYQVSARSIYMNNGYIATIRPEAFYSVTVSNDFDLSNNDMGVITGKMFGGISSVGEHLYLNANNLTGISYDAFDNVNLGYIYLSDNQLTVYPQAVTLQNPQRIYMANNILSQIPDGSFTGQTNLEYLVLSNNELTEIQTGLFSPITGLTHLHLDNNLIERIDENTFSTLTALQYIYLQNNLLSHFPALGTQPMDVIDLFNNDIESVAASAFSTLTSLNTLNLTGNELGCQCEVVSALNDVESTVDGAYCFYPTAVNGTSFDAAYKGTSTYYIHRDVNATSYQCSGANVVATALSGTQIQVAWEQPSILYFQPNTTLGPSPALSGMVTYQVTCVSPTAATLYDTKSDNADVTPDSFTITLSPADPGSTYDCSMKMVASGITSARSSISTVVTPDSTTSTSPAGVNDVELIVKYYDFSKTHTDFGDVSYPSINNPSYVASPYGAWMTQAINPTTDTFATWYRHDSSVNYEINSTIILRHQSGTVKQYWSDSFFPVDGQGYAAEQQRDCNGVYHNFGFTTAIRTGVKFAGTEKITLGGEEAMWLFVNKVKLIDYVSDGSTPKECFYIDLSPALTPGGGTIIPQQGSLSGTGTCTGLTPMTTTTTLELTANEVYHFDLFLAETKSCTSEFLFQVEDTTFSTDSSVELPMDYSATIAEDFYIYDILTTMTLTDVFSVGPYSIVLYNGNENRLFEIKADTAGNQFTTPTPTTPSYTTIVDIDGNTINYLAFSACPEYNSVISSQNDFKLECTTSSTPSWTTNLSDETLSVNTSTALLTLKDVLDYEQTTDYSLLMTVEDLGLSITGSIGIRVFITDINDNCPTISPTSVTLTPLPVLVNTSLVTFTSTDADSGDNSDVRYVVTAITADPPVDYNDTMDLWGDVYLNYTILIFDVVAMDNGTTMRGSSASVNITVSNTCVMDVLFGDITVNVYVDKSTGGMYLRIPKYYVVDFLCDDLIGLTSGIVLDSMLSASSSFDEKETGPGRGRVNQTRNIYSELDGAWIAGTADTNQYIEVDVNLPYKFTKVHIQGRDNVSEWVTSYKIFYYNDSTATWDEYTNGLGNNIFLGTTGSDDIVIQDLDPAIFSNKIRINPQTWVGGNVSLRIELNGCQQAEQLYYDVSCVRCEATNYCEGEGVQKPCGRCDPYDPLSTCGRNPIEHSFGHSSECSPCPTGWICKDGYATVCPDYHYVECNTTWCPTNCTQCEPGYACADGRRTQCTPGYYSDGYAVLCKACEANTYQNSSGASSCINCPTGYFTGTAMTECSQCSMNEYSVGDGTGCQACPDSSVCPCLTYDKCYNGTGCYNTGGGTYACNPCPTGYTGDGVTCVDIDECTAYNPCFNARCINTVPGYQCLECPEGYSGTFEDAYAWTVHQRVFLLENAVYSNYTNQTCEDIDECAINHGGCDPLMPCVNTLGSYYCDFCQTGYIGTNRTGCYLDNFCISGAHDCNSGANCIYLGPAQYRCECKPGYAGNGEVCGLDSDNDGHPDKGVSCTDWGCYRDNCPSVSNSNQEDTDSDNKGNNCDDDDDNDGRYDWLDNCQYVSNWNQSDSDGDGVGDACDNCPNDVNADQIDTDGDGTGDVCDTDDDNDGVLDGSDNCPLVVNAGQENTGDTDSVGDACDNCVSVDNDAQTDADQNGVGDDCDTPGGTNKDEDGDSILDFLDNCPNYPNADQSDIDGDGTGDLCDTDIDADGFVNGNDNCVYLSNPTQTDTDGDGVGDDCETDSDGDGYIDKNDTCPHNPSILATSFQDYFTVDLDPSLSITDPVWEVKNNGAEVQQTASTGMPTMLIGNQAYGAVEYSGTWFTTDTTAQGYFGCVFGYVSNQKFYLVMWTGTHHNYLNTTYKAGIKGVQLKVVNSATGPSTTLAEAVFHSYDTAGEVSMIWQDPDLQGWSPGLSYRWIVSHQPSVGYIRIQIYQGYTQMVDSGSVYDSTISGGRLGVFQFGEFPVIWAYLKAACQEHQNQALYFDGVDDYVTLNDVNTLNMDDSFTIETWLKLDSGYTSGPYPILCTTNGTLCLWTEGGVLYGRYGNYIVNSTTTLTGSTWYSIVYRHSVENETLTLFLDGVNVGETLNVGLLNWTDVLLTQDLTLYIGRDNNNYLRGTLDELRLYSVSLQDYEITSHISLVSIQRQVWKSYGILHFKMEEASGTTTLTNSGSLSGTASLSGGTFVTSYQQFDQFQIAYPNNRR